MRSAAKRLGVDAFELARQLDRETLGGKLDRRQRILDLVREPPRDFRPRGVPLRLNELRYVVEDDDVAGNGGAGEPRTAHQHRARMTGDGQLRFLLPLAVAAGAKSLGNELGERSERGEPPSPLGERKAGQVGHRLLEDDRRARVAGAQPIAVVERKHAGRQIAEDAFEIRVRGFDRAPRFLGLGARLGKLRGHRVERLGENAELVARRDGLSAREVALGDRARAFGEKAERRGEALRQHDGEP